MTHARQAMLEELQRRNYAQTTIDTYIHAVEQFAKYFTCSPDRLTHEHLRTYQAYLLRERKLGARTVRLHVAAIRFFFVKTLKRRYSLDHTPYPKAPRRLPIILTIEEVRRLIEAARRWSCLPPVCATPSYGICQVRDIDSTAMLIHIQHGKGGRDRYVPLSATLLTLLCQILSGGSRWKPMARFKRVRLLAM